MTLTLNDQRFLKSLRIVSDDAWPRQTREVPGPLEGCVHEDLGDNRGRITFTAQRAQYETDTMNRKPCCCGNHLVPVWTCYAR